MGIYSKEAIKGNDVVTVSEDADCTIVAISNSTGSGDMTVYKLFDGVNVSFNNFHLGKCESNYSTTDNLLNIEHCREGRIEWDSGNDEFIYISAGDMMISRKNKSLSGKFSFPVSHYHGVTISIDTDTANEVVSKMFGGFSVDVQQISSHYCNGDHIFVIRGNRQTEHIFSELYNLPDKIRLDYCKIKVLELLLALSSMDLTEDFALRRYYGRANVEKVKKITALMTSDLQRKYTLSELSEKFSFPLTSMKNCFKAVYGQSVYAYMRTFRMNKAAVMLKKEKMSVVEIAGAVGYDNAGKFAAAFKSEIGVTPTEFKRNVQMD